MAQRRTHPPLLEALKGRTFTPLRNLTRPAKGFAVTAGAADRFTWRCVTCGHEWENRVSHAMTAKEPCGVCGGRTNPPVQDLLAKHHLEFLRNVSFPDRDAAATSSRATDVCRWRCLVCDWEWETRAQRAFDDGCPKCKVADIPFKASVAHLYPHLIDEFVENLTNSRTLAQLRPGSTERCRWKCRDCGRVWDVALPSRTLRGAGCRPCSFTKRTGTPLSDDLKREFHRNITRPSRTADTTPAASSDRIEWRCFQGHLWETTANARTKNRSGCAKCGSGRRRSRFELEVGGLITRATGLQVLFDTAVTVPAVKGRTIAYIDLYLPSLGLYMDLDPVCWHDTAKSVATDQRKVDRMAAYQYLRVRPSTIPQVTGAVITVDDDGLHAPAWLDAISAHLTRLGVSCAELTDEQVTDVLGVAAEQWLAVVGKPPSPSLAEAHPEVAAEFIANLTRPTLTPELMAPASNDRCLWRCATCSHEWETGANPRTSAGTGCPKCGYRQGGRSGARARPGQSLLDLRPDVAELFVANLTNPGYGPEVLHTKSADRCHWRCSKCDGVRELRVADAVRRLQCPQCGWAGMGEARIRNAQVRGRVLALTHPELAAQVDVERTGRGPEAIPTAGKYKIWWTCPVDADHQWEAAPYTRTNPRSSVGCPFCAGKRATAANNLAVKFPLIAAELDTVRSGCRAEDLLPRSHKVMPWICSVDASHRWEAKVSLRTGARGGKCPYCRRPQGAAEQQMLW